MIGIGDSWCSGEGAWPDWLLKKYNYDVQYAKHRSAVPLEQDKLAEIEKEEQKYCWLTQLCEQHFPDYTAVNLGLPGKGNIAAAQQLKTLDLDLENNDFIILYCLTTYDRYDIYNVDRNYWETYFPDAGRLIENDTEIEYYFSYFYAKHLWCKEFAEFNTLSSLIDVQNFAKAFGGKMLFFNGFNQDRLTPESSLYKKINWAQCLHTYTEYKSFLDWLLSMEMKNIPADVNPIEYLRSLSKPSEYLTQCLGAHPTIKGHAMIAQEIAHVINTINQS